MSSRPFQMQGLEDPIWIVTAQIKMYWLIQIPGVALVWGLAQSMDPNSVLGLVLHLLGLLSAVLAPFSGRLYPMLARWPPADPGWLHGSNFSRKEKHLLVVSPSQSPRTDSNWLWLVICPSLIQYLVPGGCHTLMGQTNFHVHPWGWGWSWDNSNFMDWE